MVVIKHRLYLLIQAVLENLFFCFPTQKHCSVGDFYNIGFIMISVSVHSVQYQLSIKPVNLTMVCLSLPLPWPCMSD